MPVPGLPGFLTPNAPRPVVPDLESRIASAGRKYDRGANPDLAMEMGRSRPAANRALVKEDSRRVSQGGRVMSTPTSRVALRAASNEQTVVGDPDTGFIGDAQRNLSELVRGLPQLPWILKNEGRALPESIANAGEKWREGSNPFQSAANVVSQPGFRLVPGAFWAEQFATGGEGWEGIRENPVYAGLDILPYASKAAGSTKVVRAAEAAAPAGQRVGKFSTVARYGRPSGPKFVSKFDDAGNPIDELGNPAPFGLEPNLYGVARAKASHHARGTNVGAWLDQTWGKNAQDVMQAEAKFTHDVLNVNRAQRWNPDDVDIMNARTMSGELANDPLVPRTRQQEITDLMMRDRANISTLNPAEQAWVGKYETELATILKAGVDEGRLVELQITTPNGSVVTEIFPKAEANRILALRRRAEREATVRATVDRGTAALDDANLTQPWTPDHLLSIASSPLKWGAKRSAYRAELQLMDMAGYGRQADMLRRELQQVRNAQTLAGFDARVGPRVAALASTPPSPFRAVPLADVLDPALLKAAARTDRAFALLDDAIRKGRWQEAVDHAATLSRRTVNTSGIDFPSVRVQLQFRARNARAINRLDKLSTVKSAADAAKAVARQERQSMPARWSTLHADETAARLGGEIADLQASGKITSAEAAQAAQALVDRQLVLLKDASPEVAKVYRRVAKEVSESWMDLAERGLDPIFVHRVPPSRAGKQPRVLPANPTISAYKARIYDFSPAVENAAVALSHQAAELLSQRATGRFLREMAEVFGRDLADLHRSYEPFARDALKRDSSLKLSTQTEQMVSRDWRPISVPDEAGKLSEVWVPRSVEGTIRKLNPSDLSMYKSMWDPALRAFRTALLPLSPRWHVYNIIGGAIMITATEGFGVWRHLNKGRAIARGIDNLDDVRDLPPITSSSKESRMAREADQWARGEAPGNPSIQATRMWDTQAGRFLDRIGESAYTGWLKDAGGRVLDWSYAKNQLFDDMYRSMAYLEGAHKAAKKGMSKADSEAMGVTAARRTLQNWDRMTPMERSIIRSAVPFYSWTKHILKYAYSLPFDSPLRVSVTASLVRAEMEDFNTGLPQRLSSLINISGLVDTVFGEDENRTDFMLNMDGFNPFRDVASYGTIVGFFGQPFGGTTDTQDLGIITGQLAPQYQIIMGALGVDPSEGMSDPYQNVIFDPETGGLKVVNESNIYSAIPQAFIPQSKLLFDVTGVNKDFQRLVASNPEAAVRRMISTAGIPSVARTLDPEHEVIKTEARRYEDLRRTLSTSLRSRDFSALDAYRHIPAVKKLQSELRAADAAGELSSYTPPSEQELRDALNAKVGGQGRGRGQGRRPQRERRSILTP